MSYDVFYFHCTSPSPLITMLHCMICIHELKFLAVHLCEFVQQKVQELGLEQKYEQNREDKREKTKYLRSTTFPKLQKGQN